MSGGARFRDTVKVSAEEMIGLAESLGMTPERDRMAAAILAASWGNVGAALFELSRLRVDVERLEEYVVAGARREGRTWEQIGRDLAVSKQAAHKRFRHLDVTAGKK